jgi:hypothetical protein
MWVEAPIAAGNCQHSRIFKTLGKSPSSIVAAKNRHNFFYEIIPRKGEPSMPIKHAIFAASMAALAALSAPALAKHSDAPKASEPSASSSSSCSARQQTADGTWTQLPCQEVGSPSQPPRKSATRSTEEQTH